MSKTRAPQRLIGQLAHHRNLNAEVFPADFDSSPLALNLNPNSRPTTQRLLLQRLIVNLSRCEKILGSLREDWPDVWHRLCEFRSSS